MLRNIGSNWLLMGVTGLATFFLMPFNLAHLGTVNYGIWIIISTLTAYLGLLNLGVPMASVRHMTQAMAEHDSERLNRIIASCAVLYVGLGLVTTLLGLPLLLFFEGHYVVPADMQGAARSAFLLSLVQMALCFIAFMPYAILQAYQAFVAKNVLMTAAMAFRVVINIVLVLALPDLTMLAVVMLSMTLFELVICWIYVFKRYPDIRPGFRHISYATIREMMGFSAYVFLMAFGQQLTLQTNALVIGYAMTTSDVVSFAIPNNLMLILLQFVTGIASVIMPHATQLQTEGDKAALRSILYRWTKIALAISWCAGLFLLIFGPDFLHFWIKSAYTPEAGRVLRILMASYLLFLPIRGVAVPMLMGLGQAKWPTLATLAAGVLNLALSLWWVGPYGVEGVAWAVFIPNVLLAAVMAYLVCQELEVPIWTYLGATLPLATIGGFAGFAVLGWWHYLWGPQGFVGLGVAGVLTVAVVALLWGGLVLRNDPDLALPRVGDLLRGRST